MCTSDDAERKVKAARGDPAQARKELLEAAEIYLTLSMNADGREREHLAKAEELFSEARKIPVPEHVHAPAARRGLTFKDIGGLSALKEEIRFKIIEPLLHPEVYAHYGKKAGGGILLYGPPGCGNSLIAEATAGEAKAAFFHVKPSNIKSKYVGEAERNIAELFRAAREQQPSIIFFDEFETLGAERGETAANERGAIAQLLAETDGMGAKGQQVLLLAATNEPWSVDLALQREGRFGATVFVPAPDSEARKEIFKIHLAGKPLSRDIRGEELLAMTEGFSGADIKAVCEKAADIPLREYFRTGEMRPLHMADFLSALKGHRSVVGQWLAKARREMGSRNALEQYPELTCGAAP